MPIGPNGEKRPGDPIANAVLVGKIVTGLAKETYVKPAARQGGKARAEKLTSERRSEIAKKAAAARWK